MSYLVNDVFPAGIVLPYAGSTAPAGWLLCDGTSYIRNDYLRLFNAIGTAHGSLAGNAFSVPDYRGRFLRGTDNMGSGAAGRDPNTATRTAATTGGNTGNNVGSVQDVATKTPTTAFTTAAQTVTGSIGGSDGTHTHEIRTNSTNFYIGNDSANFQRAGAASGIAPSVTAGTQYAFSTTTNSGHGHGHTLSAPSSTVNGGGDAETRPLNAYVNYIIKI